MFPYLPDNWLVQKLWEDFLTVHKLFSADPLVVTAEHIRSFEVQSIAFVDSFVYLYPAKHVTPYMRCMMFHVAEFMVLHGSILPLTQQGLEKYNNIMTKDYFRPTSHLIGVSNVCFKYFKRETELNILRAMMQRGRSSMK